MHLTWHIVRKDLRRVWPWLILSVSATLGRYVWFKLLEGGAMPFLDEQHIRSLHWHVNFLNAALIGAQYIATVFAAATLFLEDPPAENRAFWCTRPISGQRLLSAKLILAIAVCVVVPIALRLGWWWTNGLYWYDLKKWLLLATLLHAGLVAVSWAVAGLTRSVGAFTTGVLVFALYAAALTATASARWNGVAFPSGDLVATRLSVAAIVIAVCIVAVTTKQYLVQNARVAVLSYSFVGILLLLALPLWQTAYHFSFAAPATPRLNPVLTKVGIDGFDGKTALLHFQLAGVNDDLSAKVAVRDFQWISAGKSFPGYVPMPSPAPLKMSNTLMVAAHAESPGVHSCRFHVLLPDNWTAETFRDKDVALKVAVEITLSQRQIATVLPVHAGAHASGDDSYDRIVGIKRGTTDVIIDTLKRRAQMSRFSPRMTRPWLIPHFLPLGSRSGSDRQVTPLHVQSSSSLQVDFVVLRGEQYTASTQVFERFDTPHIAHEIERYVGTYVRELYVDRVVVSDSGIEGAKQ